MSMGYGGVAQIVLEDADTVIYAYAPYDLGAPKYSNREGIYDGMIEIRKDALAEPEIHEKRKRMPSGRKKIVTKRIRQDVDYAALIASGKIVVQNSRFCWHIMNNGVGMIAMRLIFRIFQQYQDEGALPKEIGYHVRDAENDILKRSR